MKKLILFISIILNVTFLFSAIGDTLVVQTFTFADIEKRRDVFDFPDDDRSWEKIFMHRTLKCDEQTKQDSFPCGEWDYSTFTLLHIPKGDTTEIFELENYVTPYGMGIDLNGECGWTYIYDVTDYAPLLKGKVDISSGNQQELLDMKFIFIEGTPPRDVVSVENVYDWGSYKYEHIATDSLLKPQEIVLDKNASAYKLLARISGHGHQGPRNCCEWDRKTHTYSVNGYVLDRWLIWKNCGDNPIYPQGGTWQFDRAGWCPGTPVDTYELEISDFFQPGDTLMLDYEIEMYRDNGEKDGMFRQCHQLISYGKPNFETNAEIYDIITPSDKDGYSRKNPIIKDPEIIIRNSGSHTLKSLIINYGLKGGRPYSYIWNGNLEFTEQEHVILPNIDWKDFSNTTFQVIISDPNGTIDEYPYNNKMTSTIVVPDLLPSKFTIHIEVQGLGRAKENAFYLINSVGTVILKKESFEDNEVYKKLVNLEPGLYELKIIDRREDGMIRQWWYGSSKPELVGKNGKIELLDIDGKLLKKLKYDFAESEIYRFRIE